MHTFSYRGTTYYWRSHRWLDTDYIQVEERLARELDLAFPRPAKGPMELARLRRAALESGNLAPLRGAGKPDVRDPKSVAIHSAIYRDLGQPERAVRLTEGWRDRADPAVLVVRAAALCDMELWDEAARTAQRARRYGAGYYADSVLRRIAKEKAS